MKRPAENNTPTNSPIEERNLQRIGESVTLHRAGSGRPHKGVDLFARPGSPVLSAVDGKVLRVIDGSASEQPAKQRAGWFVDILGSDGLIYRYLHLSNRPSVRANQPIQAGTPLGTVGTSGIQRAKPHVHFEIRKSDYSGERRDYGEPVDPLTVLPRGNITNGGLRMAEKTPQTEAADRAATIRPVAMDINSPDAQAALAFLTSKGWTHEEVEQLINKHVPMEDSADQVEQHLLLLGWSKSDVARLLVGPEQAHQTAESLFRQHAANPQADQAALVQALTQAGAQKVQLDPALLSGLDAQHLSPGKPGDLDQLISQFATLPDVQKRRFLLLLNAQKSAKKSGGITGAKAPQTAGPAGDALPVVKSSLDLLNTALKGLLGSKGGSKKGASGGSKGSPVIETEADDAESDDSAGRVDEDDTDRGDEESGTNADDTSWDADEPVINDNESALD